MSRFFFNLVGFSGLALGAALLQSGGAIAAEPQLLSGNDSGTGALQQVTSVSQLSDVKPTDWAFQALQSLVERYGCIAGYPDKTYRGNRSLTRYEFAAGLNACLDRVNELIAASTSEVLKAEDLALLNNLQNEFAGELAVLRGRVDTLEARATRIEKQQFSTTTKLRGETIFSVGGVAGSAKAGGGNLDQNVTLSYRARLNFESSFTGKDLLRVRLQGRNITQLDGSTGTDMTRLSYDGSNKDGAVTLDDLFYRFPVGNKTRVWLIANGYGSENIANPANPLLQSDGSGAVSRFGRFSPIYRIVKGPGLALEHSLGNSATLSLAYRSSTASDSAKGGLFNGDHSALAQLTFTPTKTLNVGLTYARAYYGNATDVTDSTGSAFAQNPFNGGAAVTNSYGAVASWRVSPQFNLSGWVGVTNAEAKSGANSGAKADIFNWSVALAFPDLGKKGNLGGVIIGVPPKATSNTVATRRDQDTSLHVEALYRHQLTDKISITPGLIVILNPEHNSSNPTQYVGVVRTTFSF